MADDYNATIVNAFCSRADIEDVTKDGYDFDSQPDISELVRAAELEANEITMWLTELGHAGKTPALVAETSIEGKALRRLNALRVARTILQDRPTEALSQAAPSPERLDERILTGETRIRLYFQSLSGSASPLASHVTRGDTAASTVLTSGGAVEEAFEDYVTIETKF